MKLRLLKRKAKVVFNHYFPIVLTAVYISGFVAVFAFTILQAIKAHS